MAKKSPPDPVKSLEYLVNELIDEFGQWEHIHRNGCGDPFWSDGCNLNLIQHHICRSKELIVRHCTENQMNLPEQYYWPTPPEVSQNYFADPNSERAKRIIREHRLPEWLAPSTTQVAIKDNQLVLF